MKLLYTILSILHQNLPEQKHLLSNIIYYTVRAATLHFQVLRKMINEACMERKKLLIFQAKIHTKPRPNKIPYQSCS